MSVANLVRFGSIAVERPEVGLVYAQLLSDGLTGRAEARGAEELCALVGVKSKLTVYRAVDTLVEWGLLARGGSRRAPKYLIGLAPNLSFCEDVVRGMFGQEVLDDVQQGNRGAQLIPTAGPRQSVVEYALAAIHDRFTQREFFQFVMPSHSQHTGTGYVTFAYGLCPGKLDEWKGKVLGEQTDLYTSSRISPELVEFYGEVYIQAVNNESVSVVRVEKGQETLYLRDIHILCNHSVFPTVVPLGFVSPSISTRAGRAAKTRRETLPATSRGFVYWSKDDLQKDTEYFQSVVDLVQYGNQLFRLGETVNWQLYIVVRNCLDEEEISADQIRKAFKAASVDAFWKDKASVMKLCKDPNRIRELSRKSGHDPYIRSTPALPELRAPAGDAIAF